MKKRVVLPIGSKRIYEEIARGLAVSYKYNPEKTDDLISNCLQEYGEEAYLFSFTPSGELGENPQTPRISESFYNQFPEIYSNKGWIAKRLASKPEGFIKDKIRQFRSASVSLVQLFTEINMGLKTSGKDHLRTDFDYPVNVNEETSEEEFKELVRIEKNRYVRLFVATLYTNIISSLLKFTPEQILNAIKENDLWNLSNAQTYREQFRILRNAVNRKIFIDKVKDIRLGE